MATNYCSWICSDILSVAQSNPRLFNFYQENVEIKVGNGSRILFWEDAWKGSCCIQVKYPRSFSISIDKGVTLKEMVDKKASYDDWFFRFQRNLRAWEDEELKILKEDLGTGLVLCLDTWDNLRWNDGSSGCFNVKAAYNWCEMSSGPIKSLSGVIWNNTASSKSQFFAWLV